MAEREILIEERRRGRPRGETDMEVNRRCREGEQDEMRRGR